MSQLSYVLKRKLNTLYMLLHPPEMDIELMEMLQECSERGAFGHLGECIDILGETFATIAELAVGAGDVGMGVVDITGEKDPGMDFAPIGTHLLAVFATGVEVGDLIGAEHIVHVLGQFCLQRGHDGELLAHENPGEQLMGTGEHHRLLPEVFKECPFGKELRHITNLMARLARKHLAGARKDGGTDKHRHIRKLGDQFLHQCQILSPVIFRRHMNLQKCYINTAQVIIVPLRRVADEQLALRIIMLQPILQGSTNEAASDNSNVNHYLLVLLLVIYFLFGNSIPISYLCFR